MSLYKDLTDHVENLEAVVGILLEGNYRENINDEARALRYLLHKHTVKEPIVTIEIDQTLEISTDGTLVWEDRTFKEVKE